MANEFKYTIRAEDRSRDAVRSAKRGMNDMESSAQKLGNMLKGAFTVTAIIAAGRAITRVSKELINAYAQQEAAERKLAQAVSNNPLVSDEGAERLKDYASQLQRLTTVGDEVTIELMSMAAAWGRNEREIEQMVTSAADLSAGLGIDLQMAMRGLNNVMEGNVTTLSRYIPSLRDLTQEQIDSGDAMRIINEQFGGMASAMKDTTEGAMLDFQNAWGDLKEILGESLAPIFTSTLEFLTDLVEGIGDFIDKMRELKKAREEVAAGTADSSDYVTVLQADINELERTITQQRQYLSRREDPNLRALMNANIAELEALLQAASYLQQSARFEAEQAESAARAAETQADVTTETEATMSELGKRINSMASGLRPPGMQPLGTGSGVGTLTAGAGPVDAAITLGVSFQHLNFGSQKLAEALEAAEGVAVDFAGGLGGGGAVGAVEEATDKLQFFGAELGRIGEGIEANEGYWKPQTFNLDGLMGALGDSLSALDATALATVSSIASVAAVLDPLSTLFGMMVQALTPAIDNALLPIMQLFQQLAMILAGNLLPYFEVLTPLIQIIATVLGAVAPIFSAFGELIKMMVPILKAFATPLVILATTFQWLINVVANFGDFLASVARHPLRPWTWSGGNRDTNLGSMISGAVGTLWEDTELPGLATPEIPTAITGTPAQYTTGRNITVNVDINTGYYFGNEREFAIAIRDEIRAAEALGA